MSFKSDESSLPQDISSADNKIKIKLFFIVQFSNEVQRFVYGLLRGLACKLANKNRIENTRGF